MRKVAMKGPMKDFMINMSNFFITCYYYYDNLYK